MVENHIIDLGYTPNTVALLLAHPELTNDVLNYTPCEVSFLTETTLAENRMVCNLKPSRREYVGRWYGQKGEPTCAPWSLVNACTVLEVEPDPVYIANLINRAAGFINPSEIGFHLSSLQDSVNGSEIMSQKVYLDRPKGLNRIFKQNLAFGLFARFFLDLGLPLITSVQVCEYYPKPNNYKDKNHALCLSGYQITQEGFFNIQAIDSNFGIYWLSLEHLLKTRRFNNTFVLYKRCI